MKTLLAGPWVGEFGWELFCWQGYIRNLSFNYSKTIVIGRTGNKFLYQDFCDEYVEFNPNSWLTNGWRCENINYDEIKNIKNRLSYDTYIDGTKFDIGDNGIKKSDKFKSQKFIKYKTNIECEKFDIIFHARNKQTGSNRNWDIDKWNKLRKELPNDLKICSIGNKEAFFVNNTKDYRNIDVELLICLMNNSKIIIGPSSGPMHLASLCGLKHIVWSDISNKERYYNYWNPFNTDVVFYSKENWNPSVENIKKLVINNL